MWRCSGDFRRGWCDRWEWGGGRWRVIFRRVDGSVGGSMSASAVAVPDLFFAGWFGGGGDGNGGDGCTIYTPHNITI